jgi:hypothetical protein
MSETKFNAYVNLQIECIYMQNLKSQNENGLLAFNFDLSKHKTHGLTVLNPDMFHF